MNKYYPENTEKDVMSDKTFIKFSSFVQSELGIKMPEVKKTMLQARLSKRIRMLGMNTFEEYYNFVFSSGGNASELQNMIDAVTTNKTDFFREPVHFNHLVKKVLPELVHGGGVGIRRKSLIWSAGCSTGAEPYTLAMVLSEFAEDHVGFQYSILATDISSKVLKKAALGIYNEDEVEPIPIEMRKKYLLRSRDKKKKHVRIIPELRFEVEFRKLNLMEESYDIGRDRDIIFCRNVLIYFDRSTQEIVLNRICRHLRPGGYLFIGHSETLNGLNVPVLQMAPTVYRRRS